MYQYDQYDKKKTHTKKPIMLYMKGLNSLQ